MKRLFYFACLLLWGCSNKEDCSLYTKLMRTDLGEAYRISRARGGLSLKSTHSDKLEVTFLAQGGSPNMGGFISMELFLGEKQCLDSLARFYFVLGGKRVEVRHHLGKCENQVSLSFNPKYESDEMAFMGLMHGKLDSLVVRAKEGKEMSFYIGKESHDKIKTVLACFFANSASDGFDIIPKKE